MRTVKSELVARINASTAVAENWSAGVHPKKHPPERLLADGTAEMIAEWYKTAHKSKARAMSALMFYMNRAGSNLSEERKGVLNHVKSILHNWKPETKE